MRLVMKFAATGSNDAGFTLVEALVATLLMSLILAALATLTAQWLPNWNRGLIVLQRTELAADGLDRLTDDLAEAEFITTGTGDGPPLFDGSELSVIFVRTKLAPNGGIGLEVVQIAEVGDDQGPGPLLVRSTAPLPIGSKEGGDGSNLEFSGPVVVIHPPYRVSFSYAGADRVWRDSWHAQTELPRAVRIQIRDNATSNLLAVSTAALVHAELAARCTWSQKLADCPILGGQAANGQASMAGGR
jgi:general secretion pathway protein J